MGSSDSQPAIEIRQLVKKFGAFTAVDHLDLKIGRGETYGLLGPNGSGKTTIIKILCNLLKATGGEAFLLGKRVGDLLIAPRIGYMPQETALYMDLTVHDNIRLFGEIYSMSKEEIDRKEAELLRFIDLEEWRGSTIVNLSGGMRHRVSLACSLIHDPELLFLDEPTVGVDPELRASFWAYFAALGERGITVVITTHYMDEAYCCSTIGLMRQGQLIAEGAPCEITESAGVQSLEDAFLALARRGGRS
ncbi:MAG: ABC transporter ATP-binding protein [Chloroflexota bacterium]|nr:ABC transporter ATP-binding protein [Chloroflexota bacterium]